MEKTLENPLDCKEIKPVNPKENQPCIFIGRTDAEAEAPFLWPPDVKSRLIGKDPDARKDWRQEKKGMTGDEMVGWHHGLNGQEFEQTPRDGESQGSLTCCSLQCHRFRHDWATAQQQGPELSWYPHALSLSTHGVLLSDFQETPWTLFCRFSMLPLFLTFTPFLGTWK